MFDKIIKTIKKRILNRKMIAFDKERDHDLYGKWVDGKRVYDNGCYTVPYEKISTGWLAELFSKNGKKIGACNMMDVFNLHHEFIKVRHRYSDSETYYDCDGNCIYDADGWFIHNPVEFGPDMYLIPVDNCSKFILYNYKTRKFVTDDRYCDNYLLFDGVKPQDDVIIGEVMDFTEGSGYGSLNDTVHFKMIYTINRSGKIIDFEKEITNTEHGE